MAIFYSCDCCGASGDKFATRGVVLKAYYCDGCLPSIDKFFEDRDALHTELVKKFDEGVAALKAQWYQANSGGKLPDDQPN